jgi:hypothetical protein
MAELTQKEMLLRLLDDMDEVKVATITHAEHAKNVDKHLGALNSKVATHEQMLNNHENFITKATAYATIIATGITLTINKFL